MKHKPKISLVIVSRGRPAGLRRLISALRFQSYRNFEVIVVTNVQGQPSGRVKCIQFDQPNISAARNLGIQASLGELVAFCDDDAVPEPTWLERLVEPFCDPAVGIAGGFVRGRNGIDFQWKARKVDRFGRDMPLILDDDLQTQSFVADGNWYPRVQGTNCMFRKSILLALGGFDENFAFYLDETDVCYRASKQGWATAIVPGAEVQHGFEASDRRTSGRVPKSLFTEGQSKAYFCKKHGNDDDPVPAIKTFKQEQHKRLIKLMVGGWIMPLDVKNLLRSLDDGLAAGDQMNITTPENLCSLDQGDFIPFISMDSADPVGEIFAGSVVSRKALTKAAAEASACGIAATLFCWSFTLLFHRRYFDEKGFWVQTGGLFGKSQRDNGYFQFATLRSRSEKEAKKLKVLRNIKKINLFRFQMPVSVIK